MSTLPDPIARNLRLIGIAAIVISLITWGMDLGHAVENCPYCRVERSAIGLLGVLLLVPVRGCWWLRYLANLIGGFGAVVAATQHFNGWLAIHKGEFHGFSPIYANGFLLSAAAFAIILGEWMILADLHAPAPSRS